MAPGYRQYARTNTRIPYTEEKIDAFADAIAGRQIHK